MTVSTTRLCSISGCPRFSARRGWCLMHFRRWQRNGDPLVTRFDGRSKTPEWVAWMQMLGRCRNSKNRVFPLYGGRGIAVCEEWQRSFAAFLAHVGKRPTAKHSLDRIDPDGHYEPGNVRWATQQLQQRNRRNNVTVQFRGKTEKLVTLVPSYLKYGTVRARIFVLGWPVEEALSRAAVQARA